MNILMMTNTFTPHVGGVARSIEAFSAEYRRRGHRVLTVAPEFENIPAQENDVIRIPAIQQFNGSDFSVVLPIPRFIASEVKRFQPDVIHTHHPFLIGGTALRLAHSMQIPLVFTHHTLYEQYTHYVPGDSKALKRFVVSLSTHFANLCDTVIAPSESIATLISERGVTSPIQVVPTGVDMTRFCDGNGSGFRASMGIPDDALVIGHLGRLAPEKNLVFLASAVADYLELNPQAHFLVVGTGPLEQTIRNLFGQTNMQGRLHMAGILGPALVSAAYAAMDVFAFASKSETQGMVLTEAMAAGVPVIALDASGAREVVRDKKNGRLLMHESQQDFVDALSWFANLSPEELAAIKIQVESTAEAFSLPRTADKALAIYQHLKGAKFVLSDDSFENWKTGLRMIKAEWKMLKGLTGAALNVLESDLDISL